MKIIAYGKNSRIPMALSNYVYDNKNGYEGARKTFINTVAAQPFNGEAIADALNRTPHILRRFTVVSEAATLIVLEATDKLGNVDRVEIKLEDK